MGKTVWDRSVVWGILHNPAYKGAAAFGKTRYEPLRPRLRAQRNRPLQPRRAVSVRDVPADEWLTIAVPALAVSLEAVVAAVRRRLGENFRGTARRVAKLSIADAAFEAFDDLQDLITSVPDEEAMTAHEPPIGVASTSNRVVEERRNVRVRAFLYAASREDDNDFHLIVGRAPTLPPVYMTMEVSGLPPADHRHRATLQQARDDYKAFFQDHPLGLPGASYDFYDPPIPVEIEGSLFFDMSHVTGGRPGPRDLRDDIPTIWEVHPITRIVFEP